MHFSKNALMHFSRNALCSFGGKDCTAVRITPQALFLRLMQRGFLDGGIAPDRQVRVTFPIKTNEAPKADMLMPVLRTS